MKDLSSNINRSFAAFVNGLLKPKEGKLEVCTV
jgi:hypothetical protein